MWVAAFLANMRLLVRNATTVGVASKPMEPAVVVALLTGWTMTVWAMVDALRASDTQWTAVGRRRVVWVAAIGVSALLSPAGALVGAGYLLAVRPALAAARTVES